MSREYEIRHQQMEAEKRFDRMVNSEHSCNQKVIDNLQAALQKAQEERDEAKEAYDEASMIAKKWIAKADRYREALEKIAKGYAGHSFVATEGSKFELQKCDAWDIAKSALSENGEGKK